MPADVFCAPEKGIKSSSLLRLSSSFTTHPQRWFTKTYIHVVNGVLCVSRKEDAHICMILALRVHPNAHYTDTCFPACWFRDSLKCRSVWRVLPKEGHWTGMACFSAGNGNYFRHHAWTPALSSLLNLRLCASKNNRNQCLCLRSSLLLKNEDCAACCVSRSKMAEQRAHGGGCVKGLRGRLKL
jgi:hypothetical protein